MRETGINALMKIALRFLMTLVGGIAGYQIALTLLRVQPAWFTNVPHPNMWTAFCILFFAVLGFMVTPFVWWVLKKIGLLFENMLQNVSVPDISVAVMGLIVSLLLANLLAIPFRDISVIGFYIAIALNILFAFVGIRAFLKRRDDIWGLVFNTVGFRGKFSARRGKTKSSEKDVEEVGYVDFATPVGMAASKKVLDTSALIDGRILDIANTGFLEGTLVLPRFVLTELQGVADSSDPARRARGRKGLNVVSELQKNGGMVVTTDFNLNQISRIEGIDVLNVNELANSLKPQFLPGEQVRIDIIRPGKERGQGIGYLEDGTMLVVEDGEGSIGETADITITSMLQTAAGRMVFGKLKR